MIKRKSVISVILIIAMVFSAAAFASCVNEEKEETIQVVIKIKGTNIDANQTLALTAVPADLTVLAATVKMCVVVEEIPFDYDKELDAVKRIGGDISELFKNEYTTEPGEIGDEPEDNPAEDEETTEEIVKDYYMDWVCTVNGKEATISDIIKTGDTIEWVYKQVKKELVEKKK